MVSSKNLVQRKEQLLTRPSFQLKVERSIRIRQVRRSILRTSIRDNECPFFLCVARARCKRAVICVVSRDFGVVQFTILKLKLHSNSNSSQKRHFFFFDEKQNKTNRRRRRREVGFVAIRTSRLER